MYHLRKYVLWNPPWHGYRQLHDCYLCCAFTLALLTAPVLLPKNCSTQPSTSFNCPPLLVCRPTFVTSPPMSNEPYLLPLYCIQSISSCTHVYNPYHLGNLSSASCPHWWLSYCCHVKFAYHSQYLHYLFTFWRLWPCKPYYTNWEKNIFFSFLVLKKYISFFSLFLLRKIYVFSEYSISDRHSCTLV